MLPHRRCRQVPGGAERHALDRDPRALGLAQPGVAPARLGLGESPRDRHHLSDLGLRAERSPEMDEQRRDATTVSRTRVRQPAVEAALHEDLRDADPGPPGGRAGRATADERGQQPIKGLARTDRGRGERRSRLARPGGADRQERAGAGEPQLGPSVAARTPQIVEQHRDGPRREPARRGGAHDLVLVGASGAAASRNGARSAWSATVAVSTRRARAPGSGVVLERGRNRRHDRPVGSGPALDRELRERGRVAALGNGTDDRTDARRRGGAVGERPERLLPQQEVVARREGSTRSGRSRFPRTGPGAGSRGRGRGGRPRPPATAGLRGRPLRAVRA